MAGRRCSSAAVAAAALAALAVLTVAVRPASSALLAIDLGSEFLKLSIVKPGRIPISIVINEMSKRKTPALVAFVEGDRLVGEEAASLAARYPERVYGRIADWLGRPADDPGLAAMLKASYRPYELVAAPNRTSAASLAVRTDRGETYSAEEVVVSAGGQGPVHASVCGLDAGSWAAGTCLVGRAPWPRGSRWVAWNTSLAAACPAPQASFLEYAKGLGEAAADGSPVTDAVLAVPAAYTPQQVRTRELGGCGHRHAGTRLQGVRLLVGTLAVALDSSLAGWPTCGHLRGRVPDRCSVPVNADWSCLPARPALPAAPGAAGCRQAGRAQRDGPYPQSCRYAQAAAGSCSTLPTLPCTPHQPCPP